MGTSLPGVRGAQGDKDPPGAREGLVVKDHRYFPVGGQFRRKKAKDFRVRKREKDFGLERERDFPLQAESG
jgi:hypothetical protein